MPSSDSLEVKAAKAARTFLKIPNVTKQQYTDVVTQIYPLRARMAALEKFCDEYLNLGDPQGQGHPVFKPLAPWVLMQVVSYGKIASGDIGWFSQHELAFGIPVERYSIDDRGRATFEDWAMTYPFIYVDNPLSMAGGRQIYGWSKSAIVIDRVAPNFEPNAPHCLISVSEPTGSTIACPSREYRETKRKFLEIYQQRPFLSGRSGLQEGLMTIPRTIAGSLSASFGLLETLGLPQSGFMTRDLGSLQQLLARMFDYSSRIWPAVYGGTARSRVGTDKTGDGLGLLKIITLKQFRDAENPSLSCYQAIVESVMSTDRMVDGGLLFDPLSNDSTGGIQINLLRCADQPIVDQLGIESAGTTSLGHKAAEADILRPLIPFWSKLDLSYGEVANEWWRIATNPSTTSWRVLSQGRARRQASLRRERSTGSSEGPKYCNRGSGAGLELSGPFEFQNVNIRVFPLKARSENLQRLMDEYLDNPLYKFRVKELGRGQAYVCMLIINFEKMTPQDGPPLSGDRVVRFVIPGELHHVRRPSRKDPALVPVLTFTGENWNYITESEVYGRRTAKAELQSPQSTWMAHPPIEAAMVGGAAPKSSGLLGVETVFVPELNEQQPAQLLKAITIDSPGVPTATVADVRDYLRKTGLSRYTEEGFFCVAMKQVLDAATSDEPVYKSLVGVWTKFEMGDPVSTSGTLSEAELRIYKYPGLPITDLLGLEPFRTDREGGVEVQSFRAEQAFYIGGNMRDEKAQNLATMVDGRWTSTLVDPLRHAS